MSPLVRRTLAPCGKTPVLRPKNKHREKVSVVAALTISPQRHQLGLYWRTYPRQYVNNQREAEFLRYLLQHLRGAVIVVWDGGSMHKGGPIDQVLADFPRLTLERLPPYAPEINPVEYLWNHLKYGKMPNLVPDDVFQLDTVVNHHLHVARKSSQRLRGFLRLSRLPFL